MQMIKTQWIGQVLSMTKVIDQKASVARRSRIVTYTVQAMHQKVRVRMTVLLIAKSVHQKSAFLELQTKKVKPLNVIERL